MITGGHATIFISNMDAAVQFYTEVLELKLTSRFGDHWATVEAGPGLTIGLHPASPKYPAPGVRGAMTIGLEIDQPIDTVMTRLAGKGLHSTRPIERTEAGNFAHFEDPDGNEFYLWEVEPAATPETQPQ